MLYFNSKGLLVPDTNIIASVKDLQHYFVDQIPSKTRKRIFEKYIIYSNELKKTIKADTLKQWINGSFVTNIKNPRDIDLVTFIDFELRSLFQNELKNFEAQGANEIYGVDAYLLTVLPIKHKDLFLYRSDKAYWMKLFSITKRDAHVKKHPKGFLEIIY